MKKCSGGHAIIVNLVLSGAWVLVTGCASVTEVERVSETTDLGRGGITYSLPITHLRVAIPLEETSREVTRAATLSEVLLGIEPIQEFNANVKDKEAPQRTIISYTVGDGTQIATLGQPDHTQTFYARLKGGPFRDTTTSFKLNNKGIMTKGTSEVENKSIDFAVSTLETVSKIVAKSISPASASLDKAFAEGELTAAARAYDLSVKALAAGLRIERLEGAIREEAIAKIRAEHPSVWAEWEEKGKPVLKEINRAKALLTLVQRRKGLFDGMDVLPDSETLKFKLGELDAQIAKERNHFIGEEKKMPWTANFNYLPRTIEGGVRGEYWETRTLLAINRNKPSIWFDRGLLDRSPFTAVVAQPRGDELEIVLHSSPLPAAPLAKKLNDEPERHGFPYRIPADTTVVARFKGKQLSRVETRVAQHGIVAYLPRSLGSKKMKVDLDLDESSGSLTGLTTSSTAFDPALIGKVGGSAGEILDAQKARAKAEEVKNDEVTKLTRQKELLQLQKDIHVLKTEGYGE